MIENIRLAFQGIWSHKMRSFLTMLGIIIGIAAIISIVSTIKGSNEQIKKNMIGSGDNTASVVIGQGGYPMDFYDASSIPKNIPQISDETVKKILEIKEVEAVTTYNSRMISEGVFYQNTSLSDLYVYGVDINYFDTCNYIPRTGRTFIQGDYDEYRKVMILDQKAAKSLFGDDNPIGKTVEVSAQPFTVVGVVAKRHESELVINSIEDYYTYTEGQTNGMIYIPKAAWPILYNYDEPENVTVRATSTDDMVRAGKKTAEILNGTFTSTGTGESSIKYISQDALSQAMRLQQLDSSSNLMLILIAGISLLVGGIGVMNIMLVSVTERTSEIGLKKAIGARKGIILGQFLTEAAVLTSLGGLLGVGAGIGVAYIIHEVTEIPVAIDVPASIIAVAFSMVIGLLFGFLPSLQASNLDPIEALRRE